MFQSLKGFLSTIKASIAIGDGSAKPPQRLLNPKKTKNWRSLS
jgi:hypothetical protein